MVIETTYLATVILVRPPDRGTVGLTLFLYWRNFIRV